MHPQLAVRRLQVLHAQLETQKASLLVWLGQSEDLVRQLHQATDMEMCLALSPLIAEMRREVAGLDAQSPTSITRLADLTARFNTVAQAITSGVRAMAAADQDGLSSPLSAVVEDHSSLSPPAFGDALPARPGPAGDGS